ncbi:MAG: chemotaxis protein CheA, partial [Candidatus Dadabacteria bacterium]
IVRNAIDHGIETVEERLNAGKPPRAKLFIRAFQKGNHVVIEVADDGRGIDADAVRRRALERGLITEDQELTDQEIYPILFEPGFSTRDEVSDLSGRGVGLDVVKANLTRIGGLVDIFSEPGQGTTFVLTLPITLAIIQALMVQVASEQYAIPLNAVTESLSVAPGDVETIENHEVLYRRGATLPLVRLAEIFELDTPERGDDDELYVVVVGLAERRLGLLVDRLHGQQDVVIKSIGSILRSTPGIAGATDMGDSRTVLVLDVASIIDESARMLHG